MDAKDLRNVLENASDKFRILADRKTMQSYDLLVKDVIELVRDFLSDEEKLALFQYPHWQNCSEWIKYSILDSMKQEKTILQMLTDTTLFKDLSGYQITKIVTKISDTGKKQLLENQPFLEKHHISSFDIKDILLSMQEETKKEMLQDPEKMIIKWKLTDYQIAEIIQTLQDEEEKIAYMEHCKLSSYVMETILVTMSSEKKIQALLQEKPLNVYQKVNVMTSLDGASLCTFWKEHPTFLQEYGIYPYEVVTRLDTPSQKIVVEQLEELGFTEQEKREILAMLAPEVKQSVDTSQYPKEYIVALSMQAKENSNKLQYDVERNPEDYAGLDNLLRVFPEEYTPEQRKQLLQLCKICPEMEVVNLINNAFEAISTGKEYQEAEEWIAGILETIPKDYTKAQKLAVIDNAIGKKISYTPEFGTEVFNHNNARAIWKIISSGYGVCNGIACVERYMLHREGIESELVGGKEHAFLKLPNMEFTLANGEDVTGTTIMDPTWNLTNHRYGAKPFHFCMSYEKAREIDKVNGVDYAAHQNDEALQDATFLLDDESLRKLYTSVGIADEKGQFPIKNLTELSEQIHTLYANQPEMDIQKQFLLLKQLHPEFAQCIHSTMVALQDILLDNEKLPLERCFINKVYEKEDIKRKSVLYVYMQSKELGKKFFYADQKKGEMVELPQQEFERKFACYDTELEKNNGVLPWNIEQQKKDEVRLQETSGSVIEREGEER